MVTSYIFSPLLRGVFLPWMLSVVTSTGGSRAEVDQAVDLIELNHYYDDCGKHAYDQIIFYEWSPDYRRYHVIAWCLVEDDLDRMPKFDASKKVYRVVWQDRDLKTRRIIRSRLFRETWSQTDPERANKKLLDEKYRVSLIQVDRQMCLR